jgi:hypothetical protein
MEALIYITKSALLLSLFFAAYEFLLKKETFFSQNRIFLLVGLTTAAVLPSVVFEQTHWIEAASVSTTAIHGISQAGIAENPSAIEPAYWESFSLWDGLLFVYLAGVIFFLIKFFIQLFNLFLLLKNETNSFYESGIKFIETNQKTGAFSFFKTVVFNPKFYSQDELSLILKHEKAHAANYHNIDIILAKLTQIMFWFNPLAWLYRKRICQNLEFLADREATKNLECSKNYQLSLVNASLETSTELPISNFHSSFIKTRILMLHKSKSHRFNSLKMVLILPFLTLFLISCQTKSITKAKNNKSEAIKSIVEMQNDSVQSIRYTFKRGMDKKALEETKKHLKKEFDIDFDYEDLAFNENGEINSLKIKVDCNDGYSGEANGPVPLYFERNYKASTTFSVGSAPSFKNKAEKKEMLKIRRKADKIMKEAKVIKRKAEKAKIKMERLELVSSKSVDSIDNMREKLKLTRQELKKSRKNILQKRKELKEIRRYFLRKRAKTQKGAGK